MLNNPVLLSYKFLNDIKLVLHTLEDVGNPSALKLIVYMSSEVGDFKLPSMIATVGIEKLGE